MLLIFRRYHLDEDQKYDTLKPGKLSNKLREALGLRRNEMPLFTYRMRTMGYPPGWVEEAFDANSDLALFDCDGKALDNAVKKEIKINPDKIVEYPGFNAPLEKHIKDVGAKAKKCFNSCYYSLLLTVLGTQIVCSCKIF